MLAAALVLSGCIGAKSRSEFEAIVQARGGGVSAATVDLLLQDLRARTGADDPAIRFARIDFSSRVAVFEVRNPTRPAELDTYTYRDERFVDAGPVRLGSSDDLDLQTVPLSALAFDVEALTDRALRAFESEGGYATSIAVSAHSTPVRIRVDVESPRASGTAYFDADGELLEFDR